MARTVLLFALLSVLVLGVVSLAGFLVIREGATRQALDDAKQLTTISGRLVARRINPGFATGDAGALGLLDSVVNAAVVTRPDRPREDLGPRRDDPVLR